jgi:hypothetical protein
MIAGEATVFRREHDSPDFDCPVLVELTDWEGPVIEVAFDINRGQRVYLRFRLSDLQREFKEASK